MRLSRVPCFFAIFLFTTSALPGALQPRAAAQEADMEFELEETKSGSNKRAQSTPKTQRRRTRRVRSAPSAFRIEALGRFTFAGGLGYASVYATGPARISLDLNPALGIGGGFELVLHDFFSIGARGQLHYLDVSDSNDGAVLFDMIALPRGRYQFENLGLTAYASIPLGLSIVSYDYGDEGSEAAFTLGFLGGCDFAIGAAWFLFGEFGFQWHTHGVDTPGFGSASADITYLFMHFGVKLAL